MSLFASFASLASLASPALPALPADPALAAALPFTAIVERWHDFYALAGAASATLLGLLFVAMSLRGDLEITADRERSVWSIAGQSLTSFLDILLIALAFLVPDQSPLGLGVPLLALGAFSCGISIYLHVRTRRGEIRTLRPTLYLPLPCYVAQIGVALALLGGAAAGLPALAAIVALLTFTAISTAWTLLAIPVFNRARRASSGASGGPS